MSWQLLLAISILSYAVGVLLQRVIQKDGKNDPYAFSIFFQLTIGAVIGLYAFFQGFVMPNYMDFLPNIMLMIILYAIANTLIFSSLKYLDAAAFTILFSSRALWTILAAVVFLNEPFTFKQIIGTLLIIISVIIVSAKPKKFTFKKGEIYALLAALVFGTAFANDAYIIGTYHVDVESHLFFGFVLPAIAMWILRPQATSQMKPFFTRTILLQSLALTLFYATSAITIFLAYDIAKNAAQIAPLNQTSIIIIVILSMVFLKERDNITRKILGALLSFIGVLLVI